MIKQNVCVCVLCYVGSLLNLHSTTRNAMLGAPSVLYEDLYIIFIALVAQDEICSDKAVKSNMLWSEPHKHMVWYMDLYILFMWLYIWEHCAHGDWASYRTVQTFYILFAQSLYALVSLYIYIWWCKNNHQCNVVCLLCNVCNWRWWWWWWVLSWVVKHRDALIN